MSIGNCGRNDISLINQGNDVLLVLLHKVLVQIDRNRFFKSHLILVTS